MDKSKPAIRTFRRSVSLLKKQGLIPSSVDARRATPSQKIKGKRLSTIVSKFDDVVSGKQTAIKVKPSELRAYRKAGFATAQNRVLVSHSATEKVTRNRRGEITIKHPAGIERVQLPVEYKNLEQYLTDIEKNTRKINRMKKAGERFGFRFYGNNSSVLYHSIGSAIEDLRNYQAVANAKGRAKQLDIFKNLEIVKVRRRKEWVYPSERKREMSKEYNKQRRARFDKRLKNKPASIQQEYRDANAARQKAWRDRTKKTKKKYKAYLKDAQLRAAKSRKVKKQRAKKGKKKNRRNRPRN